VFAAGITSMSFAGVTLPDGDTDGIPDEWDNCLVTANAMQIDTDTDGYGNRCDPDFDNDGVVGAVDFSLLAGAFLSPVPPASPDLDLDSDGVVGAVDFSTLAGSFLGVPGPSGLACAGTVPCTGI
jgi:hypothetical protein